MKVNFDAALKGLDGKDITEKGPEGDVAVTLKDACVRSITTPLEGDDKAVNAEAAFKRYQLAQRIYKGAEQEITPAESVLITERCSKLFGVLISGQVYEALK